MGNNIRADMPERPLRLPNPGRLQGRNVVLIIDGEKDCRRSPGDGLRLTERLVRAGASVTHHVLPVGHAMTTEDKRVTSEWLRAISR
jgi:phospholipase/carboxylesterase